MMTTLREDTYYWLDSRGRSRIFGGVWVMAIYKLCTYVHCNFHVILINEVYVRPTYLLTMYEVTASLLTAIPATAMC